MFHLEYDPQQNNERSPDVIYGPMKWFLMLQSNDMDLCCEPNTKFPDEEQFEIELTCKCEVNGDLDSHLLALHFTNKVKQCSLNITVPDVKCVVTAMITKLSGLRSLPIHSFSTEGFSSIIVCMSSARFFCHSQVLCLNSDIIKGVLLDKQESKSLELITPEDPNEKSELHFKLDGFDYLDLLNVLYVLYDANNIITEKNYLKLLNFGKIFKMNKILNAVVDYLANYQYEDISITTRLALVWNYDTSYEKFAVISKAVKTKTKSSLRNLFTDENYISMDDKNKISLCETLSSILNEQI